MGAQKAEQVDQQTTLVVETLENVAAAAVRRLVLRKALDVARLDTIPARVEDLTFFVSGPLYEAAQGVLGEDFADELLLELAPVLDRAWHDDRATVAPPSADGVDRTSASSSDGVDNVRKKSAIHRLAADPDSVRIVAEDAEEKADTIPAADEDDTGPMALLSPSSPGAVGDTIPGANSGRPADSSPGCSAVGRGSSSASHDWTSSDLPPASSDPGALMTPFSPNVVAVPDTPRLPGQRSAEADAEASRLRAVTVATRDETPPPPRSSRFTVPYLQAVLTPPRRRRRIMIVDAHDEPRRELAAALEEQGYAVVTAHDRGVARTLFYRLAPTLIIADVETIAPDFEPLGPAFEELLGGDPPSSPIAVASRRSDEPPTPPRVLLMSDGATRSIPPEVDCVVDRRTELTGILHEVAGLLPLESQRQL